MFSSRVLHGEYPKRPLSVCLGGRGGRPISEGHPGPIVTPLRRLERALELVSREQVDVSLAVLEEAVLQAVRTTLPRLLDQGVSLRMIREILGHSQISLTANLSTHSLPAMQQEAARGMDVAQGG